MRENTLVLTMLMLSASFCLAACPSADLTGDCFVDFNDFALIAAQWPATDYNNVAVMANEWLTEGAVDPEGTVWVYIDDSGDGMRDYAGNPISHGGFTGYMSKYETTNAQYCEFLNASLASGDIYVSSNIVYGSNGSNSGVDFVDEIYFEASGADLRSQITYAGGMFSIRSRDGYSMANHPVVEVSWYGATAFCNYYGYRLPTEWEWQAVADYDGSYLYGCGTRIDRSKANYDYDNPLGLGNEPWTSPVDYYPAYGYGMNDMAGNVWEWTSNCYYGGCRPNSRVSRGGSWFNDFYYICKVSRRGYTFANSTAYGIGFRVCR